MSRVNTFSEAQIKRAINPRPVVDVTRNGSIRILPVDSKPLPEVDQWFNDHDAG